MISVPWYLVIFGPVAALLAGWLTPGVWRRLKAKINGPLFTHLRDVKTQLEQAIAKDEAAIKADIQRIIARIEKIIP